MRNGVCTALIVTMAFLPIGPANADLLPAQTVPAAASADRAAIAAFLDRAEVRRELVNLGVDLRTAQLRTETLTDEEAATLAEKIRTAPAGASAGPGLVLFILAILVALIYCSATLVATGKDKPSACFFPG